MIPTERINSILIELLCGREPNARDDTEEEAQFRKVLAANLEANKDKEGVIGIPND